MADCMCPACGKIIHSGELTFDITELTGKLLLSRMNAKQMDGKDAAEFLFNNWREQNPFLVAEKTFLSMRQDPAKMTASTRTVLFTIPSKLILDRINSENCGVTGKIDEDMKDQIIIFKDWLLREAITLDTTSYKLTLRNTFEATTPFRFNIIDELRSDSTIRYDKQRFCPYCHGKMSSLAGRYRELTLTVLGGARISKSTALVACYHSFKDGKYVQWSLDPEENKSFMEEYYKLYVHGGDLKATTVIKANIPRITFDVRIGNEHICLTFIDVPGELNGSSGVDLDARYLTIFSNIDFIWYCTDRGEIEQLNEPENQSIVTDGLGRDSVDDVLPTSKILSNMQELASYFSQIAKENQDSGKEVKLVPVAYIVGKTDICDPKDIKEYGLFRSGDESKDARLKDMTAPFDVSGFHNRASDVRDYINAKNPNIVSTLEKYYPNCCYIATSAYGFNPKLSENRNRGPEAFHSTDAFMWMLAIKNLIKVRVRTERKGRFFNSRKIMIEEIEDYLCNFDEDVKENMWTTKGELGVKG